LKDESIKELTKDIMEVLNDKYHHTTIRTGFLKSTFGTLAITGGGGFIFLYFSNRQFYDIYLPIFGALLIAIGFIIYYAGDIYKINQNKHMEVLRLQRASSLIDQKIEEEQERLAEEVLKKADAKKRAIDIDTARQMKNIRDGLCDTIAEIAPDGADLGYCNLHDGNEQLKYVRYPDNFPVDQILEIGMQKLKDRGDKIDPESLKQYCSDLFDVGLISETKLHQCLIKLNNIKPI